MKAVMADNECLTQLQKKNQYALEYLIRVYFPVLCAYSFKITDDQALSEDITEEALIKVWNRHSAFRTFNDLKGFLYTTVRNMSLNALRSKKREQQRINELALSFQNSSDDDKLLYEEMLAEIRKSLECLSPKVRQIFILSYYGNMSNAEIAKTLKLSEQTVRNQKSKALLSLKKLLSKKTFGFLLLIM